MSPLPMEFTLRFEVPGFSGYQRFGQEAAASLIGQELGSGHEVVRAVLVDDGRAMDVTFEWRQQP